MGIKSCRYSLIFMLVALVAISCSIKVDNSSSNGNSSSVNGNNGPTDGNGNPTNGNGGPTNGKESDYYFFTDDFETGDHSKSENGFKWADNFVAVAQTPNGTMGLEFASGPNDLTADSYREQRFHLGKGYSEVWVKYDLYIPANFHHRCPIELQLENALHDVKVGDKIVRVKKDPNTGENVITNPDAWGVVEAVIGDSIWVDMLPHQHTFIDNTLFINERTNRVTKVFKYRGYAHNNKFYVLWQGTYGHARSGNTVNLSYWHQSRGNSSLSYSPAKDQGTWQQGHIFTEEAIFDKELDRGKWMEIIIHIKIASPANNDGIIAVYKNGREFLSVTNLPNHSQNGFNYYEYGYLLGWANTGFKERTVMYIDDVVFSTRKISSKRL